MLPNRLESGEGSLDGEHGLLDLGPCREELCLAGLGRQALLIDLWVGLLELNI